MNKREQLLQIGNELASLWGGSCYDYRISQKDKEVEFRCIEHGEKFVTSMSFSEIKEQHGIDLVMPQRYQER
jgi:hypothetical protein